MMVHRLGRFIFPAVVAVVWTLSAGFSAASTFVAEELNASGYTLLGTKWGSSTVGTPGGVVSYSFMPTGTSCEAEFTGCTITSFADMFSGLSNWTDVVTDAFAAWSSVADISFVEAPDYGSAVNAAGADGDIRLGGHTFDGPGTNLAHGYYPPPNGVSAAGDVHLDTAENWQTVTGLPGVDLFQVLTHEIGHAIGLGHSTSPDALMYGTYSTRFHGLQADDILAILTLYGEAEIASAVPLPAGFPLLLGAMGMIGFTRLRRPPQNYCAASAILSSP